MTRPKKEVRAGKLISSPAQTGRAKPLPRFVDIVRFAKESPNAASAGESSRIVGPLPRLRRKHRDAKKRFVHHRPALDVPDTPYSLVGRRNELEGQHQFRGLRGGAGLVLGAPVGQGVGLVDCGLIQAWIAARQDLDFAQCTVSGKIPV